MHAPTHISHTESHWAVFEDRHIEHDDACHRIDYPSSITLYLNKVYEQKADQSRCYNKNIFLQDMLIPMVSISALKESSKSCKSVNLLEED